MTVKMAEIKIRSSAGFSKQRPEFNIRPVQFRFVVVEVALGQVFFQVGRFPLPVSFQQCPIFNFTYMFLSERHTDEDLRTFIGHCFSEIGEHWIQK